MGSEKELSGKISTPRLQLLTKPHHHPYINSPERSGMLTPPLYTSASVPFRWEEEPGKPRDCITTNNNNNSDELSPKSLELPPRLLVLDANSHSPSNVLGGPYKSRFQSSSFRIMRSKECFYGSFRKDSSPDPERGQLNGALVVSKRSSSSSLGFKDNNKGFLGSWRWSYFRGKKEVVGGSYVFPSSIHKEVLRDNDGEEIEETSNKNVKITRIRRSGSFSKHSSSHFWATIYEGLKQVVPWKSRKLKKDGLVF